MELRRSISEKCKVYIFHLAVAQLAGVFPDEETRKSGLDHSSEAVEKMIWALLFDEMEKVKTKA